MKEKALWILDFVKVLSDMHIDLPDYASEDGIELDYFEIDEIIENIKELVENYME
jgi:metallophosphoesterase superfamily enzyme